MEEIDKKFQIDIVGKAKKAVQSEDENNVFKVLETLKVFNNIPAAS